MLNFRVTFEVVTPESAEHGDAESRGYVAAPDSTEVEMRLRSALYSLGWSEQGFEPSQYPGNGFRWITAYAVEHAGDSEESRSLHIPDHVTPSSRARILRLCQSGNYC